MQTNRNRLFVVVFGALLQACLAVALIVRENVVSKVVILSLMLSVFLMGHKLSSIPSIIRGKGRSNEIRHLLQILQSSDSKLKASARKRASSIAMHEPFEDLTHAVAVAPK
jgi:hypothetical protein